MTLAGSAREANALIEQRTFSWTTFLTYIESAIFVGVHLTSHARVQEGRHRHHHDAGRPPG